MAGRNGAGIFTVTNPDFVSGTTISSSEMDANFSDVATGITQSIAADGQTTITANLPMNSKKLTGLAAGSTAGDSVRYEQLDTTTGVKGADLTSADPLVIGTDGNYFDVTGTVGIATHTVAVSRHYFTQFDGACILTHHATTQDLPGEANITTAAGDVAEWQSTGANTVQCVNYTKADGTAVIGGAASSTDNALARFNGTTGKIIQNSGWTLSDAELLTSGGTLAMVDNLITRPKFTDYGETVNAIGSIGGGTQDIDLTLGNVVSGTVDTATTTFTFSNPSTTGIACSFTLLLTNGGSQTVNWPASVDWAAAAAPALTAAGVDILTFTTIDAGTTWYGFPAGLAMA
jgi:hypothetical protein